MKYLQIFLAMGVGIAIGSVMQIAGADQPKPAYLVVSAQLKSSEGLELYLEKARPLARASGMEILARGNVELFEGEWHHHPSLTIERFNSMEDLKAFWHSDAYQEVKKLREGLLDVAFIIALEGQ